MINQELLQIIAAKIAEQPLDETLIGSVRAKYPDIHFTYCMEDDIPNHEPMLKYSGFNLYLVDGREHCLCLTRNYEHATGIVIAEVLDD